MHYTPGQVSEMLKVPASTLSRYAREFKDHLSESARVAGRRRAYNESDVIILQKVREILLDGVPFDEVAARLRVVEGFLREAPGENRSALQLIPSIANELENAQSTARNALLLVESLASQVERLPQLESQIAALAERLEKESLARLALENELHAYKNQPWYKRVFRR